MTLIEADPFCIGLIGNVCGKQRRGLAVCVDVCPTFISKTLDLTIKTNKGKIHINVYLKTM